MELYDVGFIKPIVNTFGRYNDVDTRTKALTNPSYARVFVEVDVTKLIPPKVLINMPEDRSYWRTIIVESKQHFCTGFRMHGHELAECHKRGPSRMHETKTREADRGNKPNDENNNEINSNNTSQTAVSVHDSVEVSVQAENVHGKDHLASFRG